MRARPTPYSWQRLHRVGRVYFQNRDLCIQIHRPREQLRGFREPVADGFGVCPKPGPSETHLNHSAPANTDRLHLY